MLRAIIPFIVCIVISVGAFEGAARDHRRTGRETKHYFREQSLLQSDQKTIFHQLPRSIGSTVCGLS